MRSIIIAILLTGCVDLGKPVLVGGQCGNGRVEYPEECDAESPWCVGCYARCRWPEARSGRVDDLDQCEAAALCEYRLRRAEGDPRAERILHEDLGWCRRLAP